MMKQPVFTRHRDHTVTVDAFEPVMLVSRELFRDVAVGIFVRRGFREFEVRCENAVQRYRIVRRGRWPRTYEFECHAVYQFRADQQPIRGMHLWAHSLVQPRDMSWGWVTNSAGIDEHVFHGDWIVPQRNGYRRRADG